MRNPGPPPRQVIPPFPYPDSSDMGRMGMGGGMGMMDDFVDLEDFIVYVYNLEVRAFTGNRTLTVQEVGNYLEQFGNISNINPVDDKFKALCIQFEHTSSVARVLAARPVRMNNGHPLYIQQRSRANMGPGSGTPNTQIFLPDLDPKYREKDLFSVFSAFGEVEDLQIREGPKGVYGLVRYTSPHHTRKALSFGDIISHTGEVIQATKFNQNRAPRK